MSLHEALTRPHPARLCVKDFLTLSNSGAFDQYSKAELIDGLIICVNAQFSRHAMVKTDLAIALAQALKAVDADLRVTVEVAVELDEKNLPEPDLVITGYRGEGPVPGDRVALAIEVSDTTVRHDLDRKALLYAGTAIAEYWVVDLLAGKLHQMWSPTRGGYAERREVSFGSPVHAASVAGLAIETGAFAA